MHASWAETYQVWQFHLQWEGRYQLEKSVVKFHYCLWMRILLMMQRISSENTPNTQVDVEKDNTNKQEPLDTEALHNHLYLSHPCVSFHICANTLNPGKMSIKIEGQYLDEDIRFYNFNPISQSWMGHQGVPSNTTPRDSCVHAHIRKEWWTIHAQDLLCHGKHFTHF